MSCVEPCSVFLSGCGNQLFEPLDSRLDAGFQGLELADSPRRVTGEICDKGLKPTFFFG